MSWVDLIIAGLAGAGVYNGLKRGLLFAAADIVRFLVGLLIATVAYMLVAGWTRDYAAGVIAFFVAGFGAAGLVDWLAKKVLVDSPASKTPLAKAGAGAIGLLLGITLAALVVPVIANIAGTETALTGSLLAKPLLKVLPAMSMASDRLGLDLPQLSRRCRHHEDEGGRIYGELAAKVRFSELDGATCIACRGRVRFLGYFTVHEVRVFPKFICENCGRVSDGCQTFEGFHRLYRICPIEKAAEYQAGLDCGIWLNEQQALPKGDCPVCGLESPW